MKRMGRKNGAERTIVKNVYEEERQNETDDVIDPLARHEEEDRPKGETALPATPSARVIRGTTMPLVEVKDVKETPGRAGPLSTPAMYQPVWKNIFLNTVQHRCGKIFF